VKKYNNPPLGILVTITAYLCRRENDWHKTWVRIRAPLPYGRMGYLMGVRVLQNGDTNFDGEWNRTESIRVYLVAVSLKRAVYVLPEDVVWDVQEEDKP